MKSLWRLFFVSSALMLLSNLGWPQLGSAAKSDWPRKAIQIFCPYGAGGDTDFNARIHAKYLEKELGRPVAVINMTGNGGVIASRKVKDSAPDGYTVLINHSNLVMTQLTGVADFGFEDFEIACVGAESAGDIFTVHSKSPYKTLKDLIELTKNNPQNVKIAGTVGSLTQLEALMLNSYGARLNIVDVGAATERLAALKGGHVQVIPNPYGSIKPYLETGEFRALGIVSEERNPFMPDIPTCKEQGYDIVVPMPYTFFFPKETPKEIVAKFSQAVKKIATTNKDYEQEIAKAYSQVPVYRDSQEANELFQSIRTNFLKYLTNI